MIVFKTFWNVVKQYKGTIILYTVMLIVFGGINMQANNPSTDFVDSKPDILIVNQDEEVGLTKNLIDYITQNSHIVDIALDEDKINDALFYRDVSYVIYIPKNYREDVLNGLNPSINIKSTGDYHSSLSEMVLSRYLQIQNIYRDKIDNEEELIDFINNLLSKKTNIQITSTLNETENLKVATYFNFASYSIMAVVIFIICLVISSFKENGINKRMIISSMKYQTLNRQLLLSSFVYSLIVWLLYMFLGYLLLGKIMLTLRGLIYGINTFLFTFCSLTIALFISTLIYNKNAISGIVNVVALGSAFLCGAFVPAEWLPTSVLNIAHILPAYWYINSNDLLKTIEILNLENLQLIIVNSCVLIGFAILFIILNNIVSRYKQKVG